MRSVQDPYPSLHSVAVDPENNRVVMSDSNRGSILFYERAAGSHSGDVTRPKWQIRGPATGMMFIAGVAIDPVRREVYTVNNDIGDRMEVFPYGVQGNARPKRVLYVPHGSWGVSLNQPRDEIAISVEHINSIVIYRREAARGEAPLRVIRGPKTGLADPHGIYFDAINDEIVVTNHGNWAPMSSQGADKIVETEAEGRDFSPVQTAAPLFSLAHLDGGGSAGLKPHPSGTWSEPLSDGGRFLAPSITTYSGVAEGDAEPLRSIQGARTELNWPMGISADTVHNEIAVASYGNNSVLIFRRTDNGDVAPVRILRGSRTGIVGPMGVAIDRTNDELWVTNYGDHSAAVFSRTAQGNIAPKRILRNAPRGTPAVGFGNPGAVAYDSKRHQILVPN